MDSGRAHPLGSTGRLAVVALCPPLDCGNCVGVVPSAVGPRRESGRRRVDVPVSEQLPDRPERGQLVGRRFGARQLAMIGDVAPEGVDRLTLICQEPGVGRRRHRLRAGWRRVGHGPRVPRFWGKCACGWLLWGIGVVVAIGAQSRGRHDVRQRHVGPITGCSQAGHYLETRRVDRAGKTAIRCARRVASGL